jgi:hypothetical protein
METGQGISQLTKRNFSEINWGPQRAILGTSFPFLRSTENRLLRVSIADGSIQEVTSLPDTFSLPSMLADNPNALVTIDVTEILLVNVDTDTASFLADGEGAVFSSDGNRILIYVSQLSKPELGGAELHSPVPSRGLGRADRGCGASLACLLYAQDGLGAGRSVAPAAQLEGVRCYGGMKIRVAADKLLETLTRRERSATSWQRPAITSIAYLNRCCIWRSN